MLENEINLFSMQSIDSQNSQHDKKHVQRVVQFNFMPFYQKIISSNFIDCLELHFLFSLFPCSKCILIAHDLITKGA